MKTIHNWFGSSQANSTFIRADQNTRRLSRRFSCSIQTLNVLCENQHKNRGDEKNDKAIFTLLEIQMYTTSRPWTLGQIDDQQGFLF